MGKCKVESWGVPVECNEDDWGFPVGSWGLPALDLEKGWGFPAFESWGSRLQHTVPEIELSLISMDQVTGVVAGSTPAARRHLSIKSGRDMTPDYNRAATVLGKYLRDQYRDLSNIYAPDGHCQSTTGE